MPDATPVDYDDISRFVSKMLGTYRGREMAEARYGEFPGVVVPARAMTDRDLGRYFLSKGWSWSDVTRASS